MKVVAYNFSVAAFSRLILGGLSLVVVGILTRTLGPDGYGQYSLILAYHFLLISLADLGLYTILVREISRPGADEDKIASNIFFLRLTSVIIIVAAGAAVSWLLPYSREVKMGILIASFFSFSSSLIQVLTGVFQKYLKLYYVSLSDVLARAAQLLLIFVCLGRNLKPDLLYFVWILAVSELFHFVLVFIFSRKFVKISPAADLAYWKKITKIALPIAASLVFVLLYFKIDTILLSLMKPAADVGIYSVGYKILETVIFLPAVYVGLIMPFLSRHAVGAREKFRETVQKSFNTLAIFALPVSAYLFLRAGDIVKIISGGDFVQAIPVLKILSIAVMLIFFGSLGGNVLVALNLQKKGMWIYFLGAVFNVGANIIFIPRFSYFAAAWTTVLTELLITVVIFRLIKKEAGVAINFSTFKKAVLAVLVTVLFIIPFNLGFLSASFLSLIYLPILFLLGGFREAKLNLFF